MGIRFDLLHPSGEAAFAIGGDKCVRDLNQRAAELLGCSRSGAAGTPCWQVARLTEPTGAPLCRPDCPIWDELERGRLRTRRRVLIPTADAPAVAADLISVAAAPANGSRIELLHLLLPVSPVRVGSDGIGRRWPRMKLASEDKGGDPGGAARPLSVLSRREREILGLLALGRSTEQIADQLFISPRTVRNHVNSTLKKLRVHRRIDAILAYLEPR